MQNIKDLYILGQPIDTDLGELHFITVETLPKFIRYESLLKIEQWEIIQRVCVGDYKVLKQTLEEMCFIDLIRAMPTLHKQYKELFELCFKQDVFDKINNNDEFEYYRQLIREMNCVKYIPKNPNPEIERFNQYKRVVDSKNGVSFESMYTSVGLYIGEEAVKKLSLYKLYGYFNRILQCKNSNTSIMSRLAGGENEVEMWWKHIDLNKEEEKEKFDTSMFKSYVQKSI